jgi:hypothetical protein
MAKTHSAAAGRRTQRDRLDVELKRIVGTVNRLDVELKRARECEPLSQILVRAFAPGTRPSTYRCKSDADFLVYLSTNFSGGGAPSGWGYSVWVKSTGFAHGSASPVYIVGGGADEQIEFIIASGVTGFITLQTQCKAKASITYLTNVSAQRKRILKKMSASRTAV